MPKDKSHPITAELHSAGATVIHRSPFAGLGVPEIRGPLPPELLNDWVKPLYMAALSGFANLAPLLPERFNNIDERLTRSLLSYFDWRPRLVGAALAAYRRQTELTALIGHLLLRSDLSTVGTGYCLALASFGTECSADFLRRYLEYYLTRPDLFFDQRVAFAALQFLDARNGSSLAVELKPAWDAFIGSRSPEDVGDQSTWFAAQMTALIAASERIHAEAG